VTDGRTLTVYDGTSNTVYELSLPQQTRVAGSPDVPPTIEEITSALRSLGDYANVSAPTPDSVAGQPAYTVRLTPKDAGGLLGGGEASFDAATGVPLHVAVNARGSGSPILDLSVTDISYGAVPATDVEVAPPAGAKVVNVTPPSEGSGEHGTAAPVTGLGPVAAAVPFTLVAPDSLGGLPRSEVRLAGSGADAVAVLTYGDGLGTIVVAERAAKAKEQGPLDSLPSIALGSGSGHELATALGSVVSFERTGVSFAVAGSVTQEAAEAAARSLAS
jgi:hypothetical protein